MLDKSIPYHNIIMQLAAEDVRRIRPSALPDGFSARLFQDGDESHWARIESSVLEFDDEEKALAYFVGAWLPRLDELKKRCVFILNPDGLPVATTTAWYIVHGDVRQAHIHWVAVTPGLQGKGLGRAVLTRALSLMPDLEPGRDVLLHTQTWSHTAVRLYHSVGFRMVRDRSIVMLDRTPEGVVPSLNDYEKAIEVLRTVLKPGAAESLEADAL